MRPARISGRLVLIAAALLAGGCLYRMDIKQGNVLLPDQVLQLETGMTRPQVSFLLGTPMVPNTFNTDRWDYYFYERQGRHEAATRRLVVWFKDDKVERIEGDALEAARRLRPAPEKAAAETG